MYTRQEEKTYSLATYKIYNLFLLQYSRRKLYVPNYAAYLMQK